ncbi:glutamate synthase central domain-containing protein [uncultured Cohaesibacter sp.]|uniref:glutamate synthase central domain-containing protein n=1 Tax=uncultured Cohaesibacter sp. TaxID=1002546 RepID=UPI002931266D|nr:glutamate synthase central domain-containing protein [uncultured Cohaesibacter sp.]
MEKSQHQFGLYDHSFEKSSCGVGFLTYKSGVQTHDVLVKANEALCTVPHRGGMSAEGVGDGAGVCVDLSLSFFRKITGIEKLELGEFGVGNFFLPESQRSWDAADKLIKESLEKNNLRVILVRDAPVNNSVIRPAAVKYMLTVHQVVFVKDASMSAKEFDRKIHDALMDIEAVAYLDPSLKGLYPVSMSAHTQVYKGRLNSNEIIPYFYDLMDEDHEIHSLFFHTRFSTNTEPQPSMAQPFRLMAHNGELNTDKKNRLSEATIAQMKNQQIYSPPGQSDSARLDQTLERRLIEDDLDLITAVVAMMPPAWENDTRFPDDVRVMLEYFSLYEEKNDGPAALIFGNGTVIGARLDRLGLRPLRSVETDEYLCVMSEAGQIDFEPKSILRRGRIEAGGMLYFDHSTKQSYTSKEALEMLASKRDYRSLLEKARKNLRDLPRIFGNTTVSKDFSDWQRAVAFGLNQESYKFLMDPMMQTGKEKISAMGYGVAINSLTDQEGGMSKYFSQRFAQVTNPPLDSLREADGMTLRVALGAKPHFNKGETKQLIIRSPVLAPDNLATIRSQTEVEVTEIAMILEVDHSANAEKAERDLVAAVDHVCDQIEKAARDKGGIIILSDGMVDKTHAAIPLPLMISAANQRLIEQGLRFRASLIAESGQIASPHNIATALGFGASAVMPVAVEARAMEFAKGDQVEAKVLVEKFISAANKSLMKTMGKVGLCTAESYIGGEFFEPNFLDTDEPILKRYFPNMKNTVGGVNMAAIAKSVVDWHKRACEIKTDDDIPLLGLFKERSEGAGHTYGTTAVRGFVDMTEEKIQSKKSAPTDGDADTDDLRLLPVARLKDAYGKSSDAYRNTSFGRLSPEEIDAFTITSSYRKFVKDLTLERDERPAALRDVLCFPADVTWALSSEEFEKELFHHDLVGNNNFIVRGMYVGALGDDRFTVSINGMKKHDRLVALSVALKNKFGGGTRFHGNGMDTQITLKAKGSSALLFCQRA